MSREISGPIGKIKLMTGSELSVIRHLTRRTQYEIAKKAGVCQSMVSLWETGKSAIPSDKAKIILESLKP
jgi:DNA-binding transcriptional regulator YiaG